MFPASRPLWHRLLARWQRCLGSAGNRRPRARPWLEAFEERIVPAYSLAIDAADTFHVASTVVDNVRIFTPLDNDAVLNVSDIRDAFQAGLDVRVSTGTGGNDTSPGNITWRSGADLDLQGLGAHALTLQTDLGDSVRDVTIDASLVNTDPAYWDQLTFKVETGGDFGAVSLQTVATHGGAISVVAGSSGIRLNGDLSTTLGDLSLTGNVLLGNSVVLDTTEADTSPLAGGALSVSGTLDGHDQMHDLTLITGSGAISLGGDLGGVEQHLGTLVVLGNLTLTTDRTVTVQTAFTVHLGVVDLDGHTLTMHGGTFQVGDGPADLPATLTGTGTVRADVPVQVGENGVVAPGGVDTAGTLLIDGNLVFQADSRLLLDLGGPVDAQDMVQVLGSATLDVGAQLVGGSGSLPPGFQYAALIAMSLTGTFIDTAGPVLLGTEPALVTYTDYSVQVQRALPSSNRVTGVTSDGTRYTVQLTGGGTARLLVLSSFAETTVVQYRAEERVETRTEYRVVQKEVVEKHPEIVYEQVPMANGTSTVYVTVPVLRYVDRTRTVEEQVPVQVTVKVLVTVPYMTTVLTPALVILVDNSTLANRLFITTTANGGSGKLDVGRIEVTGSLGGIVAPTTTVGELQVSGVLRAATLAALTGPMTTGGDRGQRTWLAIGRIDGDITTGTGLAALASHQVGAVTITAPMIGRLTTTASPASGHSGDFNASLVVDTGSSTAAGLGIARIAGGIDGSIWDVRGAIGSVIVGGAIRGWSLGVWEDPIGNRLGSIRSLQLGDVAQSSIHASGSIGSLIAASWDGDGGSPVPAVVWGDVIEARTVGTLRIAGTFAAGVVLDAGFSTAPALGLAVIGAIADSGWDIRGAIGQVVVRQSVAGWELGSIYGQHSRQLGAIGSLWLGNVIGTFSADASSIGSLYAAYPPVPAEEWGYRGTIQAGRIGTLVATGAFAENLQLDAGSETAVALRSARLGDVLGVWDIRGTVGTVTVAGDVSHWKLGTSIDDGAQYPNQLGSLGIVTVGGGLRQSSINVLGRIGSIRAAQWEGTNLTARSLGTMTVTGSTGGAAGDVLFSTLTLTGALSGVGLGTARVAGTVYGSTFHVPAGDVTSFVCGKFLNSQLYVGFAPTYDGDFTGGTFLDPHRLLRFVTTAVPVVPHQADPRTDAFRSSAVVAGGFGQVRLTGVTVNNGATPFGLRVNGAANAGAVRIETLPFALGVNLHPGVTAGDFAFLAS